jgi:hypothetical protein
MKTALRIFIMLLIALVAAVAGVVGPYALRVQHFGANPANGYSADFYLYISPGAKNNQVATILVQPNNSGINSDDPQVHRRDAWWTGFERRNLVDELGVVLLVPAFIRPGEDWQIYTHALDRDSLTTERADLKRIDLQLIAMIEHARAELAKVGTGCLRIASPSYILSTSKVQRSVRLAVGPLHPLRALMESNSPTLPGSPISNR